MWMISNLMYNFILWRKSQKRFKYTHKKQPLLKYLFPLGYIQLHYISSSFDFPEGTSTRKSIIKADTKFDWMYPIVLFES